MTHTFIVALVASLGSVSYANPTCNTQLVLSCKAAFQAQDKNIEAVSLSSAFANENWDEPSLTNCVTTVILTSANIPNTSVRISAVKNLSNNQISILASAVQTEDRIEDGQRLRYPLYSNTISSKSSVGQSLNLGTLSLAKSIGSAAINEVAVNCIVK